MTWLRKVKGWNRDQGGLGLVESLMAVAILGVAVVAFLMALSAGAIAVREGSQQVVAQGLARTQLEYIKSCSYPTTNFEEELGDYDISVKVDPHPDTDPYPDIQTIRVTISRGG